MMLRSFGLLVLIITACASPVVLPEVSPKVAASTWKLETAKDELERASCPNSNMSLPLSDVQLTASPVDLGGGLKGLSYHGGWHLTSDAPLFGGLSGLDVLPSGDLLTISDQGTFFTIGMSSGVPNGTGGFGLMRGADRRLLEGKLQTDAEGLVYKDGTVLVSFERDHRILGFAFDACGPGARGIEVAVLPSEQVGKPINPNRGAEALSLNTAGELTFGYETGPAGGAPLGTVYGDGRTWLTDDADAPRGFAQVGRDEQDGVLAELFRAYDPLRGNRNVIRIGELQVRMARPMTVDNFEGIALQVLPDGKLRIWIISDDNFNAKQRTLLMAFDVDESRLD